MNILPFSSFNKMYTSRYKFILSLIILLFSQNMISQKKDFDIYTVNYPLAFMSQSICGDLAKVHFDVPSGQDPAYWNPTSEELARIQQCDLIILNGANYAKWVEKFSLPRMKIINTMKNSKESFVYSGESITHSHGVAGEHSHESLAFTTWLDFKLAQQQAQVIYQSLVKKLPEAQAVLKKNYDELIRNLEAIDQEIRKITENRKEGEILLASHPVYDYFAKAYNLDIRSLHWEPKSYPSSKEWNKIKTLKEKTGASRMLWEATPLQDTASRLQSMGIQVIVFDPAANRPKSGDFMSVMTQNINNLKNSF